MLLYHGLTPQFIIGDNLVGGGSQLDHYKFYYSYDNENWNFFDNGRLAGGTYRFSNNSPFTQHEVYVAYNLPYSYGMAADLVSDMKASPFVMPTASSDANLIIGQSPGGIDDLGRFIAPRDMWAFKLTDTSFTGSKTRITLMSGVHAQETLGSHTLDGMLRFLISNDPAAVELRKKAEFFYLSDGQSRRAVRRAESLDRTVPQCLRNSKDAIPSISMSPVAGSGTPVEAAVIALATFPKFVCQRSRSASLPSLSCQYRKSAPSTSPSPSKSPGV